MVEHLLADVDLDALVGQLSGGERRRVALVALMLGDHDLLVLDEPTNHLDVEAVAWLAEHLNALAERDTAMLVVSHDRWFLDAVCTRIWEVHDGIVDAYDGGYAAYVLARAERSPAGGQHRRPPQEPAAQRAGLAASRRPGPYVEAEVPARRCLGPDRRRATAAGPLRAAALRHQPARQGRVRPAQCAGHRRRPPERVLLDDLTWSIGPGDRIGLVGVNGAGKTTLLRLLTGDLTPTAGTVKRGKTLQLGHLSQSVTELNGSERVLESVDQMRRQTRLANGAEASASSLLEDFGFTGDKLTTRLEDLSGGERRRLQFLRLLLAEPNVLLLDEPTNDLDIDTLTVIEDYLDSWPGTLIVVTHDRYFLERVCDVTYALMGDGSCVLLPGGVEQYLQSRRDRPTASGPGRTVVTQKTESGAARQAKKDLSRIESQMTRLGDPDRPHPHRHGAVGSRLRPARRPAA